MNDSMERLERAGYALELLGEAMIIEGREVRQASQTLIHQAGYATDYGMPFAKDAAIEAAQQKLNGDVEQSVRHQIETVRDIVRSLLQ